jgi:hypothetical protein
VPASPPQQQAAYDYDQAGKQTADKYPSQLFFVQHRALVPDIRSDPVGLSLIGSGA